MGVNIIILIIIKINILILRRQTCIFNILILIYNNLNILILILVKQNKKRDYFLFTCSDICVDIFDEQIAKTFGINAVKISETEICCAVPFNHRLSGKTEISFDDLCGEKIATLKKGRSLVWDNAISSIKEDYFGFNIFEIEKFNIKTFNRCENENRIMFVTENSKKVYPFFKCIPLSKTYSIPFGLYYSKNANDRTMKLIELIKSFSR